MFHQLEEGCSRNYRIMELSEDKIVFLFEESADYSVQHRAGERAIQGKESWKPTEKKVSCCSSENAYSNLIGLAFADGTNAPVYGLQLQGTFLHLSSRSKIKIRFSFRWVEPTPQT